MKKTFFVILAFSLGMGLGKVCSLVSSPKVSASAIVIEDSNNVYQAANITRGETEYRDEVEASPGEAIQLLVMVHLGAEGTSAGDISVKVNLSESKTLRGDGQYELLTKAFINSSKNDVEDETKIIVPSDQELVFIPEHGVTLTTHGNLPSDIPTTPYNWPNPEELFGEGINLGSIESVSTVYISFKAYVSNKTANMSITKEVASVTNPDGAWHKKIDVVRGERVRFQIVVKNTGASELNDILITDQLPDGLEYVLGSSEYSTPYSDGFKTLADSWITGEGGVSQANLGKLPVGGGYNAIIVFDATVKDNASEGEHKNIAQAKANEYPDWIYNWATVNVQVEEEEKEIVLKVDKKVGFVKGEYHEDIPKEGPHLAHIFAMGEKVYYKVEYKNVGNADAENVKIEDGLPEYIDWVGGEGSWDPNARTVNFEVGTLKGGEEGSFEYEAKVKEDFLGGPWKQENTAEIKREGKREDYDTAFVWVKGGEILAEEVEVPEELPVAGAEAGSALMIVSWGMAILGWGLRQASFSFLPLRISGTFLVKGKRGEFYVR